MQTVRQVGRGFGQHLEASAGWGRGLGSRRLPRMRVIAHRRTYTFPYLHLYTLAHKIPRTPLAGSWLAWEWSDASPPPLR